MQHDYKFSFGPWNISDGADPFGPPVRPTVAWVDKLPIYKRLGFDAVMFHDDDIVFDIESKVWPQVQREAAEMKRTLDGEGLLTEIVAPRLWEDPRTIDGAFTSNSATERQWAIDRAKRSIDIARIMDCNLVVLWLAREGTYIRESKQAIQAHCYLLEALNTLLVHDETIRIAIEPKPNEPVDHAYISTIGHALALGAASIAPERVGGVIESAHSFLAGLDPSDDMAFALSLGKLWSVHLNDQNGLKYDQDKTFGAANLRTAWNQVRVLEQANYAKTGGMVAFDVKAMRTQKADRATAHLANNKRVFERLVEKVRSFDASIEAECIKNRDYEALEMAILEHLMGSKESGDLPDCKVKPVMVSRGSQSLE